MAITYSVVVPLKNEAENIDALIEELEPIMLGLNKPWELICIEDGSTDDTRTVLMELAKKKNYMRVLVFSRNFGQSSAFDAGFKAARGEYVITLDGDGQNDPHDIPKLLQAVAEADLVCGIRANRRDPFHKKIISYLANKVRSRICDDGVLDTGCSLKVYRTACLKHIKMYQGMHRFLPALFLIEGYRIKQLPVKHRERTRGKTKYNFWNRSFNTISDMLAVSWMRKRALHYKIQNEISSR